jgi:hypothetical protein
MAGLVKQYASGASDSARRLLASVSGLADAPAWQQRIDGQVAAVTASADRAIQSSQATQISWPYVKNQLVNAQANANMALATLEQIGVAVRTRQSEETSIAGKVVLYEHADYQGRYQAFPIGEYPVETFTALGYHTASSIRVPPGYVVTIFASPHFGAGAATISASVANLTASGWNDRIGSIKVETQAMAAQRAQAEAERQRVAAQLASQQAQLDATRQMLELQRQLTEQRGATAEEVAAQRQAEAELAAAQAALDAWTAAHPPGGGDVNVSVSAGGGGGALPNDAELAAEPAVPKILLYGLAGLVALKILKG